MKTRELALIIMYACVILAVAYSIQIVKIATGMFGAEAFLAILGAIPNVVAMLTFRGRRWRYFSMGAIVFLLGQPTYIYGNPFDVLSKSCYLASVLLCDLIFNSLKKPKDLSWSILFINTFYLLILGTTLLKAQLFYTPEAFAFRVAMTMIILPVIIVEASIGGYLGHKIFRKLNLVT